ncbi:MAG TPA: OB-fold domain-containing protein [Trebonia sp.]|nr:OB-fold domain-containing protein [Trebonia sp.]
MTTLPKDKTVPVAEGLVTWPDRPRLIGSTCAAAGCGTTTFPAQQSCPRCTGTDLREVPLAETGRLWTWTIQAFEPKPPYAADGPFTPYGVGYVELATEDGNGAVLVESRLTEADPGRLEIGALMRLTFIPLRRDASGATVMTFAFEPAE